MKKDKDDKLNGKVDTNETLIGGYSSAVGRSTYTKSALLVAVEILIDIRTGNLQMQPTENFKADTLKFAIKQCVSEEAEIQTDAFHSYKKLSNEIKNITISYSKKGSSMVQLHKQIMQFKNWLRGTHQKCADEYLFAYVHEYEYRFNKRNMRKWLLMIL